MLCLRGHRLSDSQEYRFALDIDELPVLKEMTWLPVIFDPSHSTGSKNKVEYASLEAKQNRADGLLVDVHPDASIAKCDAKQAFSFDEFIEYKKTLSSSA